MNEKEMLMKQLRANAFPHNNGKVMQAINIIRHSYRHRYDDGAPGSTQNHSTEPDARVQSACDRSHHASASLLLTS